MATLTISISEGLLASLRKRAESKGTTPEHLAAADLESAESIYADPSTDPFLQLAGMFSSGVPDAAENHDYYLGEALAEELTPRQPS